jgi:hypothetical protein
MDLELKKQNGYLEVDGSLMEGQSCVFVFMAKADDDGSLSQKRQE